MKALLVEDDPDLRDLVATLLAEMGHEVSAFGDAEAAWELCQRERFPLVVLDWRLPGVDGNELCRRIRALPDGEVSAVLMMTGRTGSEELAAVLDAGASDYLAKPFDLDVLQVRLTIAQRQAETLAARARAEAERAALLEREQAARAQAETARWQAALLAEASSRLAASLDYEATLGDVAELVVPALADRCQIHVIEEDGTIRRVAIAATDPAALDLVAEIERRYPIGRGDDASVARVLRSGEPLFYPEVDDALRSALARDEEHLKLMRSLAVRAAMVVPMKARGRVVGTMAFVLTSGGRALRSEDRTLAEDLADRAALAVDNARLYQSAHLANLRVRTLVASATEAQTADDEAGVIAAVGAALRQVGLNGHIATLESREDGSRLVIRHVVLTDPELLPSIEQQIGRPIIGLAMDPASSAVYRLCAEGGQASLVPAADSWLRDALPWLDEGAVQAIARLGRVDRGICAPVTDGRTVLGALTVWGASIGEIDVPALELLGRLAGGALAAQRLRSGELERARLDGALLLARTAAHELSTALGLAAGYADLIAVHPVVSGDPVLSEYVQEAQQGAADAARTLSRLQHVIRLEETPSPLGADKHVLDLDRSTERVDG
ncbi:MAG TPA: response regulator [Chloroflexota bacterium]|jgi:DNA-binding response OmpR family regulator